MGNNNNSKKEKERQLEAATNLDKQLEECDPRDLVARVIESSGKTTTTSIPDIEEEE